MYAKKRSETIDSYIGNFPEDVQEKLKKIRQAIRETVPKEAEETISYGIPTFKLNGKYVVYFAGFKKHVSIYPILSEDAALKKEVAMYKSGRGTLRFPMDKPLPFNLIKKVILELLKDNLARTKQEKYN